MRSSKPFHIAPYCANNVLTDIRTIYFKVDESLSRWVATKKSGQGDMTVKIEYSQRDAVFTDGVFESQAKDSIQQMLGNDSKFVIGEIVNIEFS